MATDGQIKKTASSNSKFRRIDDEPYIQNCLESGSPDFVVCDEKTDAGRHFSVLISGSLFPVVYTVFLSAKRYGAEAF